MYPTPINHRSLECHYTEALGHDDMKSDVPTSGVPSPSPHTLVIKPSGTEHYYTR